MTSMGLVVGLLWWVYLLWVIFTNGIAVFWPKPVYEVHLSEDSPSMISNSTTFYGSITMDREKLSASINGVAQNFHLRYSFYRQ